MKITDSRQTQSVANRSWMSYCEFLSSLSAIDAVEQKTEV